MKQLTLRGFDAELERAIETVADEYGISLNQAVLRLLRRGAGLDADHKNSHLIGDRIDRYVGTWSDEEAAELRGAIEVFDAIDEDLWK